MPTKYRPRKKVYKKRAPVKKYGATSMISRFPSTGLPESVLIKHKYTGLHSTSTTTTANSVRYRLNGLYDPLYDVGGHQPYYFDQMAALYYRYTVYAAKVIVKCATSNAIAPCTVSMKAQVDAVAPTTISVALERPLEKHVMINGGARPAVMSMYLDMSRLAGVTKNAILSDDKYSADSTGDPAQQYYMIISHQATDQTSSAVVDLEVSVIFYTRWNNRIRQSQS